MFEMLVKKIWNPNQREINKLSRIVDDINGREPDMQKLSDEELRAKTDEFKAQIESEGVDLEDILPEAFAVVREAAVRTLGMRHYDVQLIGALVLHQGRIAEMKTGEGKTLVATAAIYLNALAGKGAHLVTVNDYLARRDGSWMGPLFHFLGLSVGIINHDVNWLFDPEAGEEKITECTRKEAYQADITYATNNELGFDYLRDNMVWNVENRVQRGHFFAIVDEVDSILIDEARTPLIISGRGPESDVDYKKYTKLANKLVREQDYTIEDKSKSAQLTEAGSDKVEQYLHIENLYDMDNSEVVHYVTNAIRAKECYHNDKEYVVADGQVVIVDEFRGRLMYGRRYSDGLHQAIEAKENVQVRSEDLTLASVTFQNYFKLYDKLSGMTGTAETEEREFREVYGTDVVVVPTNKPIAREDLPDVIYKSKDVKYSKVIEEIKIEHEKGRPVLVGTRSIDTSEYLSELLKKEGVEHTVLNAKYHEKEAEIVAQAGRKGAVTIATNMAGRGTDIVLGGNPSTEEEAEEVKAAGGLCIIGTERHESRRIDNQLRGRSGRQGDPGSSKFFLALDDELMMIFQGENIQKLMEYMNIPEDEPIESSLVSNAIENAQSKIEEHHFSHRKNTLKYDDVMNSQRKIIYAERNKILESKDLKEQVEHFVETLINGWVDNYCPEGSPTEEWDLDGLWNQVLDVMNLPEDVAFEDLEACEGRDEIKEYLTGWAQEYYDEKEESLGSEAFRHFEQWCMLRVLDQKWIDHLQSIDHLRGAIGLRAYGQKDPVMEFIRDATELFDDFKYRLMEEIVRYLFKIEVKEKTEPIESGRKTVITQEKGSEGPQSVGSGRPRKRKKMGRNDPCWCGSGKKWKKCHYPAED